MPSSRESPAKLGQAAHRARDLFSQYERTISGINQRNFAPGRCLKRGFFDQFTGMRNMVSSLGACAVTQPGESGYTRVEDWNPIAQRPVVRTLPPFSSAPRVLTQEFDDLRRIYSQLVTMLHESMHVVMWEPFFTGHARPAKRNWTSACNAFEGFSFFFADIWISSQVRAEYPDGEIIFERRAASQADFSPVAVFRALGVRDPKRILEAYLCAVSGCKSVLSHPRTKAPFARQLAARLYPISITGPRANAKVFAHFERTGITSSFYDRFCAVPNIPSLWPRGRMPVDLDDPHPYCESMLTRGLAAIHDRSAQEVARVRTRRMLQTRAYYVHQLQWILQQRLVFRPARGRNRAITTAQSTQWSGRLASYLDELERLLLLLCAGARASKEVERQLLLADRRYEATIRGPLRRAGLWISRRELIFPTMPVPSVDVFAVERGSTQKLYDFLARVVAARCKPREQLTLMSEFFADGPRATDEERLARGASLLTRRGIRDSWSVPLTAIDPLRNSYRELLFNYE